MRRGQHRNSLQESDVSNDKKRILFVDDEASFLNGLRRVLHKQQAVWDMNFVGSADAAIEELHKQSYDAVISDIRMPGKDGFALLKELRQSERTRDIPVVMLTAGREDDLKCLALNLGATDLIDKPVHRDDLLARIRSVLRLKSYQDQLRDLNKDLEHKVIERTNQLQNSQLEFIWRLAKIGEYRDEQTGRHVIRVATYARELAKQMQLPEDFVEMIYMTAPLHDIGKIGVPDSILLKRGELTPEEFKIMQQHCEMGHTILTGDLWNTISTMEWPGPHDPARKITGNRLLDMAGSIAIAHHERWDGQGYPKGLKGEEIPLEARIVALADVYDALTSDRPYKQALSAAKTEEVIEGGPGSHFDPRVYAAFEHLREVFRAIRTRLSDPVYAVPGHRRP